ncbi:sigma 54 dependent transcriptional regulator domain protein, partial [Vibrio parahaemolyticus V-223/04]
TRQDRR